MLMYILHSCVWVCLPLNPGSSPPRSAQQDKLFCCIPSSSVQTLAQMTGLLSQGTATSAGEYLHVSQPVCLFLCLNLSSFHCLIFLFSSSLFYSTQHTPAVTVWRMPNDGSAVRNKKGHLYEERKLSKESRETKCFICR